MFSSRSGLKLEGEDLTEFREGADGDGGRRSTSMGPFFLWAAGHPLQARLPSMVRPGSADLTSLAGRAAKLASSKYDG
jgi:hypothetical protein